MENKNKKSKALIITIIAIVALFVALFLIYKNRDIFGVKTSASIAKIFSPLTASENQKKSLVQAGEDIKKGDSVSVFGESENNNKIVKKSNYNDSIWGTANEDINYGDIGEVTLVDSGNNSFWDSFSGYLNDLFKDTSSYLSQCSDGVDNDKDDKTDNLDPNCHIDGDLEKAYVPDHYSEAESPIQSGEGIDLVASNVTPTSSTVNSAVNLSATITNIGSGGTENSFLSSFTITTDNTKTQIDAEKDIEMSTTVSALGANSGGLALVNYTFKDAGTYYVRACADKKLSSDEGTILELSEDNNCGEWTTFTVTNSLPTDGTRSECSDEADNDGDGKIDTEDPTCHVDGNINNEYLPEYDSESVVSKECNDTIDNDEDGMVDTLDPICHYNSDLNEKYTPEYDSESEASYECNDTVDNDEDKLIDNLDPNCHTDGVLTNDYVPTNDSESESPAGLNKCLDIEQNPITFTEEEKAQLEDLTKRFYLVAPSLQSEDSIANVYMEILDQQNFSDQLDALINECYAETVDKNGEIGGYSTGGNWITYTGPTAKYGNPWYNYNKRGSYLDEQSIKDYAEEDPLALQNVESIANCTTESDGTVNCANTSLSNTSSVGSCQFNSNSTSSVSNYLKAWCPTQKTYESCIMSSPRTKTGCTWTFAFPIEDYEALLNIW